VTAASATGVPAIVLGGSGYVAGELLRLLAGHPGIEVAGAISESQAGSPVEEVFPHLAGCFPGLRFAARAELPALVGRGPRVALFSAAPHGASAALVDEALGAAERAAVEIKAVDLSADFRYPSTADYEAVYKQPHGAPERLRDFVCALPEHAPETPPGHVGHPGCFSTAVALAAVPLVALRLVEPRLQVVAVTGSTGAGKTPTATTHHPERRSNVFAYSPLAHRHEPEMRRLVREASGVEAAIHFVPQSGPFARGFYATLHARMPTPRGAAEVRDAVTGFYADSPFVEVIAEPPRLQDVAGTNRCRLGVAVQGDALVAFAALDNLVKGAAGGGIQWMNRLLGLDETAGLVRPGLGWM
jgi:N-acetyl-gamma-glutamyl-phosphate reductase